ncbi:hypothetical protein QJQ45_006837 [Haematococcus lacustris]|nr:hypothetical protein QJQ45_006837 [Haematococcus lacustris]
MRGQTIYFNHLYRDRRHRICHLCRNVLRAPIEHERWTQCGLDAEVVLLPPHQTHLGRMFMPRSTSMQMAAASIKSRVWDLLPSTDLQAVVYLDGCDLLITQPVAPMLQSLLPLVLPTSSRQGSAGSRQSTAGEEAGGQPAEAGLTDGEQQQQQQPVLVRIQPDTLPSHNATASSQGDQQGSESTQLAPPSPSSWALLQAAAHRLDACCPPGSPSCQSARVLETPPGQWLQALQCAEEQGCHSGAVMAAMPKTCSRTGSRLISKWVASRELCSHQGLDYSLPPRMQPLLSPWMPYPPCAKVELGLSRVLCQWSCTETSYIRTATFRTTITHPRLLP